jgi:hypothetical protein
MSVRSITGILQYYIGSIYPASIYKNMESKICEHCGLEFENIKIFANHVRWCKKNTTNGDKGCTNLKESINEFYNLKLGLIKEFNVACKTCNISFVVKEREKKHPEKEQYFCSRSCANSRGPRPDSFKLKVSSKLLGKTYSERVLKNCVVCNAEFSIKKHYNKKCCTPNCSKLHRRRNSDKSSLKCYRALCEFKFSIKNYPDEFDTSLIEKHGWYLPTNRGNNLGGVSRDHIISVKFGYENNINPEMISHPANCRLVIHNENISKGSKCLYTVEELIAKIEEWNKKYTSI